MAGSWVLAASLAGRVLAANAEVVVGTPVAAGLATHSGHLEERQTPSTLPVLGSLTSTLVPVATLCSSVNVSDTRSTQAADFQTISATATLPSGGSTIFATRVRRRPGKAENVTDAAGAAHLVSGVDGCSTLFTQSTFSACSTVVSPIGLPPVTVTECDQYITFSSETLFMCPPTPTFRPCPAPYQSSLSSRLAGSFTTQHFSQNNALRNVSTTYAPSPKLINAEATSFGVRSYSSASGMPMSLPRHLQEDKRQVLFEHVGGAVETESATIASAKHINLRQLIFDRGGGDAVADLVVIAPSYTASSEEQTMLTGIPAQGNTIASETAGTGTAAPASSLLSPTPDDVVTNYKREPLAGTEHSTHQGTVDSPVLIFSNITLAIGNSNNTRITGKLAKLETIRLANANHAAAEAAAARIPGAQNLSPPSPTKFYAAPWTEVLVGGVPEHVLGITCYGGGEHIGKCTEPDGDGDPEECECVTERQSWSMTSITETRIGTTIVSYVGPLVITGAGGATTTTSTSFLSTFSTTRSFVDSFILRSTLSGEGTVTRTLTSVPSKTVSLVPVVTGVGDNRAGAPQDAPATLTTNADDEPTTVVLTSFVATETITVQPLEESGDAASSEMVSGADVEGDIGIATAKRDDGVE